MGAINREDVDRRLARLRDDWGPFPVKEAERPLPAGEFERLLGYARDGYTGSGYVWLVRRPGEAAPLTESMPDDAAGDRDRVLLILPRGSSEWGLPGGGREEGENYEEAARREVREETGVDCSLTDVAHAWRGVHVPEGDDDPRLHLLFVVFEGRYEGGHVAIQPGELNGAAWFADLPERVGWATEPLAEQWDA